MADLTLALQARLTATGDRRITEDGNVRVTTDGYVSTSSWAVPSGVFSPGAVALTPAPPHSTGVVPVGTSVEVNPTFRAQVNSFTSRSGTGSQTITGLPFQPKAIIFVAAMMGEGSFADNAITMYGVDDATTHAGLGVFTNDGTVIGGLSVYSVSTMWNTYSLLLPVIDSTFNYFTKAYVSAMTSDGFTVQWDVNAFGGATIYYMAVGGTGLLAKVKTFTCPVSTGNQSHTGVGFQPSVVLTGATNSNTNTLQFAGAGYGIGAMNSAGQQGLSSVYFGAGADATYRYQRTTQCVGFSQLDGGIHVTRAHYVSMDADGFTWNWDVGANNAFGVTGGFALCLGGSAGSFITTTNQPTSPGSVSVLSTCVPTGILFTSVNAVTSTTQDSGITGLSVGLSDTIRSKAQWAGMDKVTDPPRWITARTQRTSQALVMGGAAATGSSSTILAAANVSASSLIDFTLAWGTADSTARESLVVVLGVPRALGGPTPYADWAIPSGLFLLGALGNSVWMGDGAGAVWVE